MMARDTRRLVIALAAVLAVLFTQGFLSVHELQHIGETDASHCPYAPLASVAGGAVLAASPALTPPPAVAIAHPALRSSGAWVASVPQQARAPPRA